MKPSEYFLIFSKKTESSELPVGCLKDIEVEKATMNYLWATIISEGIQSIASSKNILIWMGTLLHNNNGNLLIDLDEKLWFP